MCETCKIDTAQAIILFLFIFTVKFSCFLTGFYIAKCDFLFWESGQNVFFNHLNTSGLIYSAFSIFLAGQAPCFVDISNYPPTQKKNNFSCSLTDPTEISLDCNWFSFMFPIYFHYICSLGSYIHKLTSVIKFK